MGSSTTIEVLQQRIRDKHVAVVVGAGVSIQATSNQPASSWRGLIESGIQWCEDHRLGAGCDAQWARRKRDALSSGNQKEFLLVAHEVAEVIGEAQGALEQWLQDSVGSLQARQPAVLNSLHALNCQLVTTNYDALLDKAGLKPVTWKEKNQVSRILQGDLPGIIHLHGRWDRPESVVLDVSSYARVRHGEGPKSVLRTLARTKTLLFVGFGDGLSDPNFTVFREWLCEVNDANPLPHYRLCTRAEKVNWAQEHHAKERLELLEYGDRFDHLPTFLSSLASKASAPHEIFSARIESGPPPNSAQPSNEAARPGEDKAGLSSPAASADPRPMSPEEEKRRTDLLRGHLSKAFPGMLESLRKAVSEDSELRDLLVRFFKPEARAPEAQALELLFLFHEQFLESLGHFGKMYSEAPNAAAKERVKRLAGQALFLAMSPGYAEGLLQRHEKANGATLPMDKKAGWGVQQILACWVHRKSQVAIQSPPGGTMDVPPQRKVQTIKEGLMARFAIPPSDPSAERRLAEEIEAALNFGDIVVETVDDEAVLREIRDKDSPLRDLMVFFISDGASIRPELRGQPFDSRVSVHFKRLTTALSTP